MANGLDVSVTSNITRIKARFEALTAGIEEKAIARALNRAGRQAITEADREIRKTYNLKSRAVRAQIKVRTLASRGLPVFTMRVFSKRIPLIEFAARQTKRGVSVAVKKGSRKLIRHAFIQTMASGHKGVFIRAFDSAGQEQKLRIGKGSRTQPPGRTDTPIAQLFSLDVPTMFLSKEVRRAVVNKALESFARNFEQQVKFLLGGANG